VRLGEFERRGIFLPGGGYARDYAALSARILTSYMYAGAVPKTPVPPIATDILREMWSDRTEFRITGNLKGFDFTSALRRFKAPVLVVAGDRDIVSPATLELTRASCRRATLIIIATCAHMMFVDQTRFFNGLVEDFLTQCTDAARGRRRRSS